MNELTTITASAVGLVLPDDLAFDGWVGIGADLAAQRRNTDWLIADWLAAGQERFADQIEFEFLADTLGIAPKRLKSVAATAAAFPAAVRDASLSVDHHAHVATLPAPDRLAILRRAHVEHWTPEETRIEAIKRKVESGQGNLMVDDDPEYHALMLIVRGWNRADRAVRQQFIDLAAESDLGIIDA